MALTTGIEHLTPSPSKGQLFQGNYITNFDFTNQFLPDVYEKQAEIYGNRSISSFLKLVSAEMPSASDEIRWVEQGRLHVAYKNVTGISTNTFTVGLEANPDGTAYPAAAAAAIRVGQTIMVQAVTSAGVNTGPVLKGIVTTGGTAASGDTSTFVASCLEAANWNGVINASNRDHYHVLVYGSEFAKGTDGMAGSIDASYSSYTNKPMILKDNYQINGSDTAQIGWIEVTSENGASGYLWYLQSEHETRQRFEDYLEMSMIESVKSTQAASPGGGTEGLFAALTGRGNVYTDLSTELATNMNGFDTILKQLDKNGAIEENMLYIDKALSLAIDDALAAKNSYGTGGTSYGVFNNSEEMALNLGFSGFRRGGYDFYKTDWKYLNDFGTRGLFSDIEGVIIPAGTSTVYDQELGQNIKRPFLHVRYRASETDDRKMKTWITGSVGGAYTTTTDEMRVSFLSERCLIVQGANNFFLLKD